MSEEAEQTLRVEGGATPGMRQTRCLEHAAGEVLVCHTTEGFYAVDNLCSHAAARLSEGRLKGHRIHCPLHGAAFDVRDGSPLTRPARDPIRTYPVRIDGDDLLIELVNLDEE